VRGIFELVVLWDLYVFFILILALISILVILTKKTIKLDLVSLLILISLSVYAVSLLSFRNINDAFTLGMTCLAGYFSMHIVLKKISDVTFFKFLKYLFIGLLFVQGLVIFDIIFDIHMINYVFLRETTGIPNKGALGGTKVLGYLDTSNLTGLSFLLPRVPGVSGTPYASGGLIAAICMYFLVIKNYRWAIISFLVLSWTGALSPFFALLFGILLLSSSKLVKVTSLILSVIVLVRYGENKLVEVIYLYTDIGFDDSVTIIELISKGLIGEGTLMSSVGSEMRIINLMYAAGLYNLIIWSIIGYQIYKKQSKLKYLNIRYTACMGFLFVIIISNWHYHSIFVYPNIFIIVLLIAFFTSRSYQNTATYRYNFKQIILR